ncbi:MAG: DNA repair exonuclease [Chloroflexi bacterium]|nr:DNA repair exonuclease [Chloroflexota bacterium]
MADVHLGARHHDLGAAAAQQRERQFGAFSRAVDLALAERVELVLIAGDLFDSNAQPRRSVERAAGELRRLAESGVHCVVIPGTHDCYDVGSIYRVFDLPALADQESGGDRLRVLTPGNEIAVYPALDLAVGGRVFETKRAPESPFASLPLTGAAEVRWRIGLLHGSLRVEGKVERDDVLFTEAEIGASGLDYLALGHWHSFRQGSANGTVWAYAGAPEPVAVDQDGAGQVLLVDLEVVDGRKRVTVQPQTVGRTRFRKLELDAGQVGSQDELVRRLRDLADPDLVLDVRLVGLAAPELELHDDEIERQLEPAFLKVRFRDVATRTDPDGPMPPPDTIAGAFIRDLEARIHAAEAAGRADVALEARESLRLGRLLLDDPQRVTLA